MSQIDDLAEEYVRRLVALDPIEATQFGIPGHESELTDYSPAGYAARAELARATLGVLGTLDATSRRDRLAADTMRERLSSQLDMHEARDWMYGLRALGSPLQEIQQSFSLMATDTDQQWEWVAERLEGVPGALQSFRATLEEGIRAKRMSAQRQVLTCAEKARVWAGVSSEAGYFQQLAAAYHRGESSLQRRLRSGAQRAEGAFSEFADYLKTVYLPLAPEQDAVGAERYQLAAAHFNATPVDPQELYRWGWEELARVEQAMAETAERIEAGAGLPAAIELLDTDPKRALVGTDALMSWNQELLDRSVSELNGTHFDIPAPVRRVEARLAPPGSGAAMYYTRPSEDFSRPGRTWYPARGQTRFPLWTEVSTCYHEGVPGHHLQLAQICYLKQQLNVFQRTAAWNSGVTEGWALYAERLMGELGFLDNPDYYLGMLAAHAMRAARVVVDIGLHLQLAIPSAQDFHPGEVWSYPLAVDFMTAKGFRPRAFFESEVERYLGLPGQAIAYKLGERFWLETREEARRRWGSDFTLKRFHKAGLDLGMVGLDQLRRELPATAPSD